MINFSKILSVKILYCYMLGFNYSVFKALFYIPELSVKGAGI